MLGRDARLQCLQFGVQTPTKTVTCIQQKDLNAGQRSQGVRPLRMGFVFYPHATRASIATFFILKKSLCLRKLSVHRNVRNKKEIVHSFTSHTNIFMMYSFSYQSSQGARSKCFNQGVIINIYRFLHQIRKQIMQKITESLLKMLHFMHNYFKTTPRWKLVYTALCFQSSKVFSIDFFFTCSVNLI